MFVTLDIVFKLSLSVYVRSSGQVRLVKALSVMLTCAQCFPRNSFTAIAFCAYIMGETQ